MYYDRTISDDFEDMLCSKERLKWLVDSINGSEDLDLHIGKNHSIEWASVYRGLSRILQVTKSINSSNYRVKAADTYLRIAGKSELKLFDKNSISDMNRMKNDFTIYHAMIKQHVKEKGNTLHRYYDNLKEGYWQTEIIKRYGLHSESTDEFVIIDRETVVGFLDESCKNEIFGKLQKEFKSKRDKVSQLNPVRYGKDLSKKALGNELDSLAIGADGKVYLLEIKFLWSAD